MVELDGQHPGYGLADHKGYGTARHVSYLQQNGPSPIHRHSFAPVIEATQLK
jgi:ribonuclease HII